MGQTCASRGWARVVGAAVAVVSAVSGACGTSAARPDAGDTGTGVHAGVDSGASEDGESSARSGIGGTSARATSSGTATGSVVATSSEMSESSAEDAGQCVGSGTGHGHCGKRDGGTQAPIVCPGYSSTLVVPIPWVADGLVYTDQDPPGFAAGGALVLEFTTPAVPSPPPTSKFGSIQTVQDPGRIAPRNGSLSATPCDFTVGITGQPSISTVFASQDGPDVPFTLGYTKIGPGGNEQLYVRLQPNTTYYLNMYNPAGCGGVATCDVRVQFSKQPGT